MLALLVGFSAVGEAGLITLGVQSTYSEARDDIEPYFDTVYYQGTELDGVTHLIKASVGDSSSATSLNFSDAKGKTTIAISMHHFRSGNQDSYGLTNSYMLFQANQAHLTYTFAGSYTNELGYSDLYVNFVDVTTGMTIYSSRKSSIVTDPESFAFGQPGGNLDDYENGALSGALIDGHEYQLIFQTYTYAYLDSGAAAFGDFKLTIAPSDSSPQPIPEPSSLALLATGGLIGAVRLRRRPQLQPRRGS